MDPMTSRLILASSSPRRKMLLEQLGLTFDVVVSDIDERQTRACRRSRLPNG